MINGILNWMNVASLIPSDQHNLNLLSWFFCCSMSNLVWEVPFCILQYVQCIFHWLTCTLLCVPFIFADRKKYRFSGFTYIYTPQVLGVYKSMGVRNGFLFVMEFFIFFILLCSSDNNCCTEVHETLNAVCVSSPVLEIIFKNQYTYQKLVLFNQS